ncbi:MAG TPA: methyltransferase, TIGR04325 family [Opitutaceae bacterium]|nr:methyltransferase, TIGR04325 family [Opitutaceae bacterium]
MIPDRVAALLRRPFQHRWFHGDFATWAGARAASGGYDDGAILARVLAATREVQAGRAVWERDGVVFVEPAVHAPLLAALRAIAVKHDGHLDVVDFGGALGSTWWQHRAALADLAGVRWRVVEQPHYVAAGREFADRVLSFHDSLASALAGARPAAILLSSVLPYLEKPHELLADVTGRGFQHVIIDRTPLISGPRDRLVVQRTPPEYGGGSYPCWLFASESLLAPFRTDYRLLDDWPGFEEIAPQVVHRGFFFQRVTP